MSILFDDHFVATNGTLLSAYGNGWSVASTAGGVPTIGPSGTLSMGTAPGASLAVQGGVSLADATVAATAILDYACGIGILLRYTDANNWYLVDLVKDANPPHTLVVQMYKNVAGSVAAFHVQDSGVVVAPSTPFALRVDLAGSTFGVSIDGSLASSWPDSDLTLPGLTGLRNGDGGTGTRSATRFTVSGPGGVVRRRNLHRSRTPWSSPSRS